MRIDIVSIFPAYLDPLELSLAGKARDKGLLDLHVHDLRDWTHDRHRTVDDTPAGGGAGMVMSPGPWGEALDALATEETTLVVPTPSGTPFTQALARELSTRPHLLFACGRYEGIDQRVRRPRPHQDAGRGGLDRRLRPQRRRGRRPGDRRGGGPAGARLHGQRGVPGGGVPRGRAARAPRLHQAGPLARPRRPAGAAVGRPRGDRPVAARAVAAADRRAAPRPAAAVVPCSAEFAALPARAVRRR